MSRILIATMPIHGHVVPMFPVARELVARGHDVVWYGSKFHAGKIRATGATFAPMQRPVDYGDGKLDDHFPARTQYQGLAKIKCDYRYVFIDPIEGQLADLEEILDEFSADVLLTDTGVIVGKILSERRGIPWAVLNISVLGIDSRDIPPFGIGALPDYSLLGHLRTRALYWLAEHVIFREVQGYFDRLADQNGWAHMPIRPPVSPYLYLQPTVPGLEYPRSDMPAQVHFIGPLLPDAPAEFVPPAWWAEVDATDKPIILVTQGTVATDAGELIAPALAGLAGEDVLVVAATGSGTAEELGLAVPDNARVEPFIPFVQLMPHVSAFITNGGYGGVTIALASGVPVIAGGTTEDKPEVCNRVQYSGVGINLRTAKPTSEQIREAVRTILADRRYPERARLMQVEFDRHDAPVEAAVLIEQLAETKQPVYSPQPMPERLPGRPQVAPVPA